VRTEGLRRRLSTAAAVAVGVVVADALTKRWAEASLAGAPIEIIPGALTFTFAENPGSAFSLFQDAGTFLGLAAFVALGIVAWALVEERTGLEVAGFGLIAGGAAGNLLDRITRGSGLLDGAVVDWIQFPNFPVFNFADSAITVGVGLLLIAAWRQR